MEEKKKSYQLFRQNSELEVLISAAIVFTAFVINDVAGNWIIKALNLNVPSNSPMLFVIAIAALYMSSILPISLISHFVLRIYWLSLVGLKSVYPEAKKETVNPKFDRIVNDSLNVQKQIEIIDKICSSIFAFTFLTLFAFLFTFLSAALILFVLQWVNDPFHIAESIGNIFLLLGMIYLVDFLSLGYLKKIKKKWFAKLYYPVYRFFGWITLAGLYRGIYYTLIQYASKKVMIFITPLYIIGALFLLNQGYDRHIVFPDTSRFASTGEVASGTYYKDQFKDRMIIQHPFLDSFVIPSDKNYLRLHLPLTGSFEEKILGLCDGVQPFNERGVHWRRWIQNGWNMVRYDSAFDYQQNAINILACVSDNLTLKIDSLILSDQSYFFGEIVEPANFGVIITMMDVSDLSRGNHKLIIKTKLRGDLVIPFWRD